MLNIMYFSFNKVKRKAEEEKLAEVMAGKVELAIVKTLLLHMPELVCSKVTTKSATCMGLPFPLSSGSSFEELCSEYCDLN